MYDAAPSSVQMMPKTSTIVKKFYETSDGNLSYIMQNGDKVAEHLILSPPDDMFDDEDEGDDYE